MNKAMPPLPHSDYRLASLGSRWEEERITRMDGYTEEQMYDYARAYAEQGHTSMSDSDEVVAWRTPTGYSQPLWFYTAVQPATAVSEALVPQSILLREREAREKAEKETAALQAKVERLKEIIERTKHAYT